MPLPVPRKNEKRTEFVGRCMANSVAKKDFPKIAQRVAVCNSQWTKSKKRKI